MAAFRLHVAFVIVMLLPLLAVVSGRPGAAQSASCPDFQFFEFAQTAFEADPSRWAALDSDGDGLACPDLPNGVAPALWTDRVPERAIPALLRRVVDGDTIVIDTPAGPDTVRIIMADTPETKDPSEPDQCFGPEATAYTTWLLGQNATLYLEPDITDRDRYGRLLRYVWLDFGDGFVIQLNEAIVRSGHGVMVTYPPDVAYVDQIRASQEFARRHGLGLWSACASASASDGAGFGIAAPTAAPAAPPAGNTGRSGGCDPSYPTLCLPSTPDVDCGDIPERRFAVRPPDPHDLDGDQDGVGCESG